MNRVHQLIRSKLADGRLPHASGPRVWAAASNGEFCHACETVIPETAVSIEGTSVTGVGVHFHVGCFYIWDSERGVSR